MLAPEPALLKWETGWCDKKAAPEGMKLRGGCKGTNRENSGARLKAPRPDVTTGLAGCNTDADRADIAALDLLTCWLRLEPENVVSNVAHSRNSRTDDDGF
jgi:hypothetical protein